MLRILLFAPLIAAACGSPSEKEKPAIIIDDNSSTNSSTNGPDPGVTECGPSRTLCDGACVDTTADASRCGSCTNACGDNMVCSNSTCVEIPDDCRIDGATCPARYYCDELTGLCASGCTSNVDCPGSSYCELGSHTCLCTDASEVVCGESCVPETALSCGATCETCATIANGTTQCSDGACVQECDSGHMMCDGTCAPCPTGAGVLGVACLGNQCVANECASGHEICEGTCAQCPASTADDSVGCDGASCVITDCEAGTRLCNGVCADCPSDANGQATCQGTQCVIVCATGFHNCGGVCVADDDRNACGSSCTYCPDDPNGSAVCSAGSCALSCDAGFRECASTCAQCPSGPGVLTTTCAATSCVAATCEAGYAPCASGCCRPAPDGVAASPAINGITTIALALDSRGYPHIAYGMPSRNEVEYVTWDGSAWQQQSLGIGWHVSVEIDAMDRPHFATWRRNPDRLWYGEPSGTSWTFEGVSTAGVGGATPDLVLVGNTPHIAHFDYSATALRYAVRSGGTWSDTVVVSADEVGFSPSMAIAGGVAHFTYRDETFDRARYSFGSGSSWSHETLSTNGQDAGNYSSLALNAQGMVEVAYVDSPGLATPVLWYARRASNGTWTQFPLTSGLSPTLIFAGSMPVIVYDKPDGTGLRYMKFSGGDWTDTIIDSTTSIGAEHNARFDAATGRVHVVYSDYVNHTILYKSFVP